MPAKHFRKSNGLVRQLKIRVDEQTWQRLTQEAADASTSTADHVRNLVQKRTSASATPRTGDRSTILLLAEVHELARQISRIGTNVNQLAKQANTGMVPLTKEQMAPMQTQVGAALNQAMILFGKVRDHDR